MNLNGIADPSADSVLDLLVEAEARANGTAETTAATAEGRGAYVAGQLEKLHDFLRADGWDQHTTGVHFVRLLADLVEARGNGLEDFVNQTIDAKRNAFRPYRVSQYVRARYGVGITNHTVQRMLGLMADAGRHPHRATGGRADGRSSVGQAGGVKLGQRRATRGAGAKGERVGGGPTASPSGEQMPGCQSDVCSAAAAVRSVRKVRFTRCWSRRVTGR